MPIKTWTEKKGKLVVHKASGGTLKDFQKIWNDKMKREKAQKEEEQILKKKKK